jgi:hypothetical protein
LERDATADAAPLSGSAITRAYSRFCRFGNVRFPIAHIRSLVHARADMRLTALIVGIAATLMGLLWVGQGAGLIHWPASSFMIDQRPWVARGALLILFGVAAIAASRVRR